MLQLLLEETLPLVLKTDSIAWVWGNNSPEQLNDGTIETDQSPSKSKWIKAILKTSLAQ